MKNSFPERGNTKHLLNLCVLLLSYAIHVRMTMGDQLLSHGNHMRRDRGFFVAALISVAPPGN